METNGAEDTMEHIFIRTAQLILTTDKEEAEAASAKTLEEVFPANHQDEDLLVKAPKVVGFNPGTFKEGGSKDKDLAEAEASHKNNIFTNNNDKSNKGTLQMVAVSHLISLATAAPMIGTAISMTVITRLVNMEDTITIDNQWTQQWRSLLMSHY